MPREYEDFRANLERLNELIPEREMLTVQDVQTIMGWRDGRTVKKYIPLNPLNQVSKVTLARIMSGGPLRQAPRGVRGRYDRSARRNA